MKALALTVQKLWRRFKFLKSSSKVKVKVHKVINFVSNGKVLPEEIYMCNMKALALMFQNLWPRLKFLKSRLKVKVKVTRSKILPPVERFCQRQCTCEV